MILCRGVSGYGGHNSVGFIGGGVDRGYVGEVSLILKI